MLRHALIAFFLLGAASAHADAPKATGKLCDDVAALLGAAKGNFDGYADLAKPLKIEGDVGWSTGFKLAGATSCWIVQPDPKLWPDARAYRCDVPEALTKWKAKLRACPGLEGYALRETKGKLATFGKETGDDHIISLHLTPRGFEVIYSEI